MLERVDLKMLEWRSVREEKKKKKEMMRMLDEGWVGGSIVRKKK